LKNQLAGNIECALPNVERILYGDIFK
jgi:hypothetical protein